jgi:hypothetical protein
MLDEIDTIHAPFSALNMPDGAGLAPHVPSATPLSLQLIAR